MCKSFYERRRRKGFLIENYDTVRNDNEFLSTTDNKERKEKNAVCVFHFSPIRLYRPTRLFPTTTTTYSL